MDMMSLRFRMMSMMGGNAKMIETGTYTPSSDVTAISTHIAHSLGVVPDFVLVIADAFTASADMSVKYIANSYCAKSNFSSSNKSKNGFAAYLANWNGRDTSFQTDEDIDYTKFLHQNNFEVPYYNSNDCLKSGITYHYIIGTFS